MQAHAFKTPVDNLEARAVPASGITLTSGVLRIEGGTGNDRLFIIQDSTNSSNLVAVLEQGATVTRKTYSKGAVNSIQAFGMDGNDSIVNDIGIPMTADGGAGNDSIWGGSAADSILGGSGNDQLLGRGGNDKVDGGSGNDSIWGGDGSDSILGGSGDDVLVGGSGHDFLDGGDGNDQIWAGAGNSTLLGGNGNDILQ